MRGALVSIDAIATNAKIAQTITDADADYLLAVKANQPTLRAEIQSAFVAAGPDALQTCVDFDKGHGRIEQRTVSVLKDVNGSTVTGAFPASIVSPALQRSFASSRAPNSPAGRDLKPAITFCRPP